LKESYILPALLVGVFIILAINANSNGAPSVVYVDDDWAGLSNGTVVNGHTIGYDAFASIQDAVNAVASGGTIYVWNGTYNEDIDVTKTVSIIGNGSKNCIVWTTDLGKAVFWINANYVIIKGFNLSGGGAGVTIRGADYCNISNNIMYNNKIGVWVAWINSPSNWVEHNIVMNNKIIDYTEIGVEIEYGNYNEIKGNMISGRGNEYGIYIDGNCQHNKIISNYVTNNDWGIYIANEYARSALIYNNYFDNENNVYDEGAPWDPNIWNISKTESRNIVGGPYLGGNYWSDYTGVDADGDGIGDSPYQIPTPSGYVNRYDYLPLIKYGVYNINKDEYYKTIQAAIENASDGDIIKVYPGTYDGPIVINKEIKLIGDPIIDGHGGYAINITANNTLIENFTIHNASVGIYVHNDSFILQNITINNCTIYNESVDGTGIYFEEVNDSIISNCKINDTDYGIYFDTVTHTKIYNCSISGGDEANIYGYESSKNEIFDCNISDGEGGIFFEKCWDNSIHNCNVSDNGDGIDLIDCSHHLINDCNISDNGYGILLNNVSDTVISYNNISDNEDGVYLGEECNNITIEHNIINNNVPTGSCPFLYSWNGRQYIFDSDLVPGSVAKSLERKDYDILDYLKSINGECRLKITEELHETSYIDEIKLLEVAHPDGVKIIPDNEGNIHTISNLQTPLQAFDFEGRSCIDEIKFDDRIFWQSNLSSKNFSDPIDWYDGIILTFEKPEDAKTAKIVIDYRQTMIGEFMLSMAHKLRGEKNLLEELNTNASLLQKFLEHYRDTWPNIRIWNGTEWIDYGYAPPSGPWTERKMIKIIDISNISGNTLTISVGSMTASLLIDFVGVDYSEDIPVEINELQPVKALKNGWQDVASLILQSDDEYLMLDEGDYVEIVYSEENIDANKSYVIMLEGYYVPELRMGKESHSIAYIEENLQNLILNYFYNRAYGKCGIYVTGSSFVSILYNNISNNDDGIYVGYSNNVTIAHNNISDNSGNGVKGTNSDHMEISNNYIWNNSEGISIIQSKHNEIMHNHIYNNSLCGIKLDSSSTHNNVVYNRIYNNTEKGICIYADHNSIENNTIRNCNYGIDGQYSHNVVLNNTIYTIVPEDEVYYGIYLQFANYYNISLNHFIYNISQNESEFYAIILWNSHYNIIDNNTIEMEGKGGEDSGAYGIELGTSTWNIIENNSIFSYNETSVYLYDDSNNNTLKFNNITNAFTYCGIDVFHSPNNTICRNTIYNVSYGIEIANSPDNIVEGNEIMNASNYGIEISGSQSINNVVERNFIKNATGIIIYSCSNTRVVNNTIMNITLGDFPSTPPPAGAAGIWVGGSELNYFFNNTVCGSNESDIVYGIVIRYAYNNTFNLTSICNLSSTGSAYGIYVDHSDGNEFDGISIHKLDRAVLNDFGIYLDNSDLNNFSNVEIYDLNGGYAYGIYLTQSDNNSFNITDLHNFSSSSVFGIFMHQSCNNTFNDTFINSLNSSSISRGIHIEMNSHGNHFNLLNIFDINGSAISEGIYADKPSLWLYFNNVVIKNVSSSNYARGIMLEGIDESIFNNITIDSISSLSQNAHGIGIYNCNNNILYNVSISNITAMNGDAVGIYIPGSDNNTFINISIENLDPVADYDAYGIHLQASNQNEFYNLLISNLTAIDNSIGICLDSNSAHNVFINTSINNLEAENKIAYGIWIIFSSNNTFSKFKIHDIEGNERYAFYSDENSKNNSIYNMTIASYPTKVSFTYGNGIALKGVSKEEIKPNDDLVSIKKFVNITNITASSWINITFHYTEDDLLQTSEATLALYEWNGSKWNEITFELNEDKNFIRANITSFSIYGIFGELTKAYYHLYAGWNTICLSLWNEGIATAEDLGSYINSIAGYEICTVIVKWDASKQRYISHVVGFGEGFSLKAGEGYFIYVKEESNFTIEGTMEEVNILLYPGYDFIGWIHPYDIDAKEFGENISNCTKISSWNASMQQWMPEYSVIYNIPESFIISLGDAVFPYRKAGVEQWHG